MLTGWAGGDSSSPFLGGGLGGVFDEIHFAQEVLLDDAQCGVFDAFFRAAVRDARGMEASDCSVIERV